MPPKNGCFSSYSSSSFSSSSSSSQLSTPRAFHNGALHNSLSPRLSIQTITSVKKSPLRDSEKTNFPKHTPKSKSSEELRTEIAELETEILHLEQYLLSLYRITFGDHLSELLPEEVEEGGNLQIIKTPPLSDRIGRKSDSHPIKFQIERASSVSDTSVSCRRSLASSFNGLPKKEVIKRTESGHRSLADLLGVSHMIEDLNTPNKLSEQILRSICLIYSKFSDSSQNKEPEQGFAVVVHKLRLDEDNIKAVESMLENFRLLVRKLEKVDPGAMTREQKLAFWINIYNALLMHAYITYGTSERMTNTMILKVAYNVGGECIRAYHIQSSILGIHLPHSAPRLKKMFSPARKSRTCSSRHAYALDYPEPLVHFVLSSGMPTDPMVRVYTAESIFQELKQSREDFIRTNIQFVKETKIILPKTLYNYAKDASLGTVGLLETIAGCLPETERMAMGRFFVKGRHERCIRWLNQDSSFRYVIHGDVVKGGIEI